MANPATGTQAEKGEGGRGGGRDAADLFVDLDRGLNKEKEQKENGEQHHKLLLLLASRQQAAAASTPGLLKVGL